MLKQENCAIEDSNLANFGTELETNIKKAAAECEDAWKGAGTEPGLQKWRIEKFQVVESKDPIEEFYEGDAYIVLNTYKQEGSDALAWDIHFWLGKDCTQDEAGTAAYKSVELDDFLNQAPVQHREVHDHESHLFLSYFKEEGGIRILEGGIASGFRHVEPTEYRPRLLHLRGRKFIRVKEVEMNASSLNGGDVFIVDNGLELYQWNGSSAGIKEKMRAAQLVRSIDSERSGKPNVTVMEQGDEEDIFWELLGGKGDVADDIEHEEEWETKNDHKLFKLSDESGDHEFEAVDFSRDSLDSNDAFVLDVGHEIFVWIGKDASPGERRYAMKYAQDYVKTQDKPHFLPFTLVYEGSYSTYFDNQFN